MVQVSERVARVQREEVMRIRMDERTARAAMPQHQREADHQHMMGLVLDAKEIGYLPAELDVRLEVEEAIELAGQPTEDWYTSYKAQQSAQEVADVSQPSSRSKFMDGMSRMSSALDNQTLAAQSQPNITPPGPR